MTGIRFPNIGGVFLHSWRMKNLNKTGGSKVGNFLNSTKVSSPTGKSGESFMYTETISNIFGSENVFCSFD